MEDDLSDFFGMMDESSWVSSSAHRGAASASYRDQRAPKPRNSTRLAGLYNQGATCYLNSLLQTLYMTPEFRAVVYALSDRDLEAPQKDVDLEEQKDVDLEEKKDDDLEEQKDVDLEEQNRGIDLEGDEGEGSSGGKQEAHEVSGDDAMALADDIDDAQHVVDAAEDAVVGAHETAPLTRRGKVVDHPLAEDGSAGEEEATATGATRELTERDDPAYETLMEFGFDSDVVCASIRRYPVDPDGMLRVNWILAGDHSDAPSHYRHPSSASPVPPYARAFHDDLPDEEDTLIGDLFDMDCSYDAHSGVLAPTTSPIVSPRGVPDGDGGDDAPSADSSAHAGKRMRRIPLELQRLFARLQEVQEEAASTTALTESFGWSGREARMQHDVHELNRVLFSAIEESLAGTRAAAAIADLYEGQLVNQIVCTKCGAVSERPERFQDLGLIVKGYDHVLHSLHQYFEQEELSGANAYDCSSCNDKVTALKGAAVRTCPPLLILCLNRFDYDWQRDRRTKLTQSFPYPFSVDMSPFTERAVAARRRASQGLQGDTCGDQPREEEALLYDLFSVVIHRGSPTSGHYHAYIKDVLCEGAPPDPGRDHEDPSDPSARLPTDELWSEPAEGATGGHWYDFNDSRVTAIDERTVRSQFGGSSECAYMLVYRWRDLGPIDVQNLTANAASGWGPSEGSAAEGSSGGGSPGEHALAQPVLGALPLPAKLMEEMQGVNASLRQQRAAEETAHNTYRIHVYLPHHVHVVTDAEESDATAATRRLVLRAPDAKDDGEECAVVVSVDIRQPVADFVDQLRALLVSQLECESSPAETALRVDEVSIRASAVRFSGKAVWPVEGGAQSAHERTVETAIPSLHNGMKVFVWDGERVGDVPFSIHMQRMLLHVSFFPDGDDDDDDDDHACPIDLRDFYVSEAITLKQLKGHIAQRMRLPAEHALHVMRADTRSSLVVLDDDEGTRLAQLGVWDGARLWAEGAKPIERTRAYRHWQRKQGFVRVQVCVTCAHLYAGPPGNGERGAARAGDAGEGEPVIHVEVSKESSLEDLHMVALATAAAQLTQRGVVDATSSGTSASASVDHMMRVTRLRRRAIGGGEGALFTNGALPLATLGILSGDHLILEEGEPPLSGQITLQYVWGAQEHALIQPRRISVPTSSSVGALKSSILASLDLCERDHAYRLRRTNVWGKPAKVFTDEGAPMGAVGLSDNDMVWVEEGVVPTPGVIELNVELVSLDAALCMHEVACWCKDLCAQVFIDRNCTLAQLKQQLTEEETIPVTDADRMRVWHRRDILMDNEATLKACRLSNTNSIRVQPIFAPDPLAKDPYKVLIRLHVRDSERMCYKGPPEEHWLSRVTAETRALAAAEAAEGADAHMSKRRRRRLQHVMRSRQRTVALPLLLEQLSALTGIPAAFLWVAKYVQTNHKWRVLHEPSASACAMTELKDMSANGDGGKGEADAEEEDDEDNDGKGEADDAHPCGQKVDAMTSRDDPHLHDGDTLVVKDMRCDPTGDDDIAGVKQQRETFVDVDTSDWSLPSRSAARAAEPDLKIVVDF